MVGYPIERGRTPNRMGNPTHSRDTFHAAFIGTSSIKFDHFYEGIVRQHHIVTMIVISDLTTLIKSAKISDAES